MRSSDAPKSRILYLLTSDLSTIFVRGQLAAVHDAGFDVHLATNFRDGTAGALDSTTTTWHVPYERDPAPLRDLRGLFQTIRLIRQVQPDIVHAGTPKAGLLGMVAAWISRTPARCYALHGLRYETTTGRGRRALIALERLACRLATAVIADSESIRSVALRDRLTTANKLVVLGRGSSNGVDVERFAPGADAKAARHEMGLERYDLVIGFIGRLTRDKGIDDLVSIFASDFADQPTVGLLLVGSFEAADPVRAETLDQIENDQRIVHVEWLDNTTVAYAAMDVLAFLSYREGLPNVPLEAQAMGVPVVGYAATGTVDAVAHPDLLVAVGDQLAISELLRRVLADANGRQVLGSEATEFVRSHFDRRVVWRRKIEFLREHLADGRRSLASSAR